MVGPWSALWKARIGPGGRTVLHNHKAHSAGRTVRELRFRVKATTVSVAARIKRSSVKSASSDWWGLLRIRGTARMGRRPRREGTMQMRTRALALMLAILLPIAADAEGPVGLKLRWESSLGRTGDEW